MGFWKEKEKPKKAEHYCKFKHHSIKAWQDLSMSEMSEDEIRKCILEGKREDICITYVCQYSKLSENFIEELIKLTEYTDGKGVVNNRIDWFNISTYQKLSKEFIIKHKDEVIWRAIIINQDIEKKDLLEISPEKYHDLIITNKEV